MLKLLTSLWLTCLRFGNLLAQGPRADVRLVTDEAEAVLALLEKHSAGQPLTESDWHRLLASEGYLRLKKREEVMKRPFSDDEFRAFVLSEPLARQSAQLRDTLRQWSRADFAALAGRLSEEQIRERGFAFFGIQGAWYTVGWKMAVTIERIYGRQKLIECFCDQRKLLPAYNRAARRQNQRTTDTRQFSRSYRSKPERSEANCAGTRLRKRGAVK
jgi:hypothetical protein